MKSLSYKSPSSRYIHINIDLHRIYHIDLKNLSHSLWILHSLLQNIAQSSFPSYVVALMSVLATHQHAKIFHGIHCSGSDAARNLNSHIR